MNATALDQSDLVKVPGPKFADSLFQQNAVHARQDGTDFRGTALVDNSHCISRLQF